jgi:hypothetical protein
VVRTASPMMADVDLSHAMTSSESLSRLTLSLTLERLDKNVKKDDFGKVRRKILKDSNGFVYSQEV